MAKTWRRPPLPKLTAKNLYEAFAPYGRQMRLELSYRKSLDIANDWKSYHNVEKTLEAANKAVEGHGVEPIRSEKNADYGSTWGDVVALYVNTGDSYSASVVYDVGRDQMYVTSYGDWVERNEKLFPREE